MPTLLEISAERLAFLARLEECGDELDPETEKELDAWFATLEATEQDKVDSYCALVREYELRAVARQAEVERLQRRIEVDENTAKRLKDRLKLHMETTGTRKIETARYTVRLQANGGRPPLKITCQPEELPPQYRTAKLVVEPNRDAIYIAVQHGEKINGVELLPRGNHLRIG